MATLRWSGVAGRTYRVLRSGTPGFESYQVLGTVLSNASPTQSFLDTSILTGAVQGMFYRVELAP